MKKDVFMLFYGYVLLKGGPRFECVENCLFCIEILNEIEIF